VAVPPPAARTPTKIHGSAPPDVPALGTGLGEAAPDGSGACAEAEDPSPVEDPGPAEDDGPGADPGADGARPEGSCNVASGGIVAGPVGIAVIAGGGAMGSIGSRISG
jgi:hypothetical protein